MSTSKRKKPSEIDMRELWKDLEFISKLNKLLKLLEDHEKHDSLKKRIEKLTPLLVTIHVSADIEEIKKAMDTYLSEASQITTEICLACGVSQEELDKVEEEYKKQLAFRKYFLSN